LPGDTEGFHTCRASAPCPFPLVPKSSAPIWRVDYQLPCSNWARVRGSNGLCAMWGTRDRSRSSSADVSSSSIHHHLPRHTLPQPRKTNQPPPQLYQTRLKPVQAVLRSCQSLSSSASIDEAVPLSSASEICEKRA